MVPFGGCFCSVLDLFPFEQSLPSSCGFFLLVQVRLLLFDGHTQGEGICTIHLQLARL